MNQSIESQQLMLFALGWLPEEKMIEIENLLSVQPEMQATAVHMRSFLQHLQRSWTQQQARRFEQREERLTRIVAWVQGELDSASIVQARQDIMADPVCQAFHEDLLALTKHLKKVGSIDPSRQLRELKQRLRPRPQLPTIKPPSFAWRGNTGTPTLLPIPAEYDFTIRLFIGGFDPSHRVVQGKVESENETVLLTLEEQAMVWLLPQEGRNWHEATITQTGEFDFNQVPVGNYTFEMAWSDNFLEVLDVIVPAI